MRLALLAVAILVANPKSGFAQDHRASVLHTEMSPPGLSLLSQEPAAVAPADSLASDSTAAPPMHAPEVRSMRSQPPLLQPILVGALGAGVGAFGGGAIGYQADEDSHYSDDIPGGTILGYFIGETVLLPVAVHLGNDSHGSFFGDLGISFLGHLGAIGLGAIGGGALYAVGMAGQIALTVANERATAERRLGEEAERVGQP
jgi:hypothetical protein